jgi:hypothetical protein
MNPLSATRPTELTGALMENELLRYEVRHLKAQLSEVTGELPQRQQDIQAARRAAKKPTKAAMKGAKGAAGPKTKPGPPPAIALRNQRAYDDVVWLVGRLDSSPVGPVLRRWEGFRILRARYLEGAPK